MPRFPGNRTISRARSTLATGALLLVAAPALGSPNSDRAGSSEHPPLASAPVAHASRGLTGGVDPSGEPPTPEADDTGVRARRPGTSEGRPAEDPEQAALEARVKRMQIEKAAVETRLALARLEQDERLSALRSETAALRAQTDLAAARRQQRQQQRELELAELQADNARLAAQRQKIEQQLSIDKAETALRLQSLDEGLELADAERRLKSRVSSPLEYRVQPFAKGVLEVSDRRIPLNGPITMETADRVAERLSFYNNKSERYPIFIVIDYSPGGSVMAGYRILKAIDASRAPVHVLVKSFAASMAAVITAMAPHSYAYPNAILLHHQILGGSVGNLTEQREQVRETEEWSRRLTAPLCKKFHMTEKKFVQEMYRHNSQGNWSEFADRAVKLGWVEHVVDQVRERGVTMLPSEVDADAKSSLPHALAEEVDAQCHVHARLPRLAPFDLWYLYDPDDYYR